MILIKRLFAQQFFFPIDFDLSDYLLWDESESEKPMRTGPQLKWTYFDLQSMHIALDWAQTRRSSRLSFSWYYVGRHVKAKDLLKTKQRMLKTIFSITDWKCFHI